MEHHHKKGFLMKLYNRKNIWFHLAGIAAIIWFLVRVVPKPDRIRYPCQQATISIALGYIAFWGILWAALFSGFTLWMRRAKYNTTKFAPLLLIGFILVFTVSSQVYANFDDESEQLVAWDPIPNEPIGTPTGANPGRVVWVWNPNATRQDLVGFWWLKANNNQNVIDSMFSKGIQALAGEQSDEASWDVLFSYFNNNHGYGDIGYQPGEKIAIKVNLNNNWVVTSYITSDNERDESPYVVKALLRQLVNVVGVAQEDITIFDSSRVMPNWFYKRIYYENYPSLMFKSEFPNVHYADSKGFARGREKVLPSDVKVHLADSTGLTRTLPTLVKDAKYLINMPILKRHPIDYGVTFSGKNLFGTWIEPVLDVHSYHKSGFTAGNPTPQTDLLAHEHLGGKTLLYLGDGTFATKEDHKTIAKFQMYPFNDDWTNSLFLSQDPVAIDSVMYDFLFTEGANPCEGSQNYLHQSAVPNPNTYDPEGDGIFLSESLGVHEHWNASVDIFSANRYAGPAGNGIDYVSVVDDTAAAPVSKIQNIFSVLNRFNSLQ